MSVDDELVEIDPELLAGLEDRDPDLIRRQLPLWWALTTLWHRAEVDGLERVPDGNVLLVGNHSGGMLMPDALVLMLAWNSFFGVGRPLFSLGHLMITQLPGIAALTRRMGAVPAGPDGARAALQKGSVLVYPGGDREVYRPWSRRNRIDFDGRQGFLRLAHRENVPLVPVVADGSHHTIMVLTDGRRMAERLGLARLARVKVLPVTLGIPFGLGIGGLPPHLPFPTKIRIEVLEPIDVRERFGDEPDWDEAYAYVTSRMQVGLSQLAGKRILSPIR